MGYTIYRTFQENVDKELEQIRRGLWEIKEQWTDLEKDIYNFVTNLKQVQHEIRFREVA